MRDNIKRSKIVQSSRVRYLLSWARKLPTNDEIEIQHALRVFAEARWGVSKPTARTYATKVLELLAEDKGINMKIGDMENY